MSLLSLHEAPFKAVLDYLSFFDIYQLYLSGSSGLSMKLCFGVEKFEVCTRDQPFLRFWPGIIRSLSNLRTVTIEVVDNVVFSALSPLGKLPSRSIEHLTLQCHFVLLKPLLGLSRFETEAHAYPKEPLAKLLPQLRYFKAISTVPFPELNLLPPCGWSHFPKTIEAIIMLEVDAALLSHLALTLSNLQELQMRSILRFDESSSFPLSLTKLTLQADSREEGLYALFPGDYSPAMEVTAAPFALRFQKALLSFPCYLSTLMLHSYRGWNPTILGLLPPTLEGLVLELDVVILDDSHISALPRRLSLLDLSSNGKFIIEPSNVRQALRMLPQQLTRLSLYPLRLPDDWRGSDLNLFPRSIQHLDECTKALELWDNSPIKDALPNLKYWHAWHLRLQYAQLQSLPPSLTSLKTMMIDIKSTRAFAIALRARTALRVLETFNPWLFRITRVSFNHPEEYQRKATKKFLDSFTGVGMPFGVIFKENDDWHLAPNILPYVTSDDLADPVIRLDTVLPRNIESAHLDFSENSIVLRGPIWLAFSQVESHHNPLLQFAISTPTPLELVEPYFSQLGILEISNTNEDNFIRPVILGLPPTLTKLSLMGMIIDSIKVTLPHIPLGLKELSMRMSKLNSADFDTLPPRLLRLFISSSKPASYVINDFLQLPRSLISMTLPQSPGIEPSDRMAFLSEEEALRYLPIGLRCFSVDPCFSNRNSFWEDIVYERTYQRCNIAFD